MTLIQQIPPLDFNGPVEIPYTSLTNLALEVPVFTLFKKQVEIRPDKLAIWDDTGGYTYLELYQAACETAQLLSHSTQAHFPIGIWLENDKKFIVAMFAALALGRPYVALDVLMPAERNKAILDQAAIGDFISVSSYKSELRDLGINSAIFLDELPKETGKNSFEETGTPESLAYIIYTSGTTGMPKGVFQNQKNLVHDVSQYIDSIHLSSDDRLSLFYSPTVNGAIRDIYGSLLTGATLFIRNLRRHGLASLSSFINKHQLTIYHSVPSIFRGFLQASGQQVFPSVRLIYLAGDRIVKDDVFRYRRHFLSHTFLYIGIGSTENATIYRQWFLTHDTILSGDTLPVGYAVPDRPMHLRAIDGSMTPVGEEGEIVVESAYMALGYWQNESLSQLAFTATKNGRQFRTGDLGRIRPDGLLEFICRKDRQVKVAGHRIELAAVESVIRAAPLVIETVVIGRQVNSEQILVAYLTGDSQMNLDDVRLYCNERLPPYMVPAHWQVMTELPLLHNFKVDISALQKMDAQRLPEHGVPPSIMIPDLESAEAKSSWIKSVLEATWCGTAPGLRESYLINGSWRNGGGSSLEAVAFLINLEEQLGIELPSEWIHGDMQPMWLEERLLNLAERIQPPFRSPKKRPVIYFFPALYGLGAGQLEFLRDLQQQAEVHLIYYPDFRKLSAGDFRFKPFMEQLFTQIASLPKPDLLIGNCSGAYPAHEAARILRSDAPIVLIDYQAPIRINQQFRDVAQFKLNRILKMLRKKGIKDSVMAVLRRLIPAWGYWYLVSRNKYPEADIHKIFIRLIKLGELDGKVHLFRMKDHENALNMQWENYSKSVSITDFPFPHLNMFVKKENREMMQNALFGLIPKEVPVNIK